MASALTARLDKTVELFNAGKFTQIIVSGVTPPGEDDESEAMSRYLQAHAIPAGSIMEDHPSGKADSMETVATIMQDQKIESLLLIAEYYRLVRLKMALAHAGENQLAQVHLGEWKNDDAVNVANEDVAIFKDMFDWYVVPGSKEMSKKALEEAKTLKESVNSKIDTMSSKVAPPPSVPPSN